MWPILLLLLVSYLVLVQRLRYRNVKWTQTLIAEAHGELTPALAQEIALVIASYDAPFMVSLSMTMALMKSYGIPSIASLLSKSGHFTTDNLGRRLADTAILIAASVFSPLTGPGTGSESIDPRSAIALARVNWLHRQYKIKNEDFLYLLSRFIFEPMIWVEAYEWRPYTKLEKESSYILWKIIGERMDIKDIPDTYEELWEWSETYEKAYMSPSPSTRHLGQIAVSHTVEKIPNIPFLRSFAKKLLVAMAPPRLCTAMQFPPPSPILTSLIKIILHIRAFCMRYLVLPRSREHVFYPLRLGAESFPFSVGDGQDTNTVVSDVEGRWKWRSDDMRILKFAPPTTENPEGTRMYNHVRKSEPWYYPPFHSARTTRTVLRSGLAKIGLVRHSVPASPRFRCEGYKFEELGPQEYERLGHEEVYAEASRFHGEEVTPRWATTFRARGRKVEVDENDIKVLIRDYIFVFEAN